MSEATTTTETVAPASSTTDVLGAMSSGQRDHWRMTGELPKGDDQAASPAPTSESDVRGDSSPAKPVEQAAETAASTQPASEPGTPRKNNAETRIRELLAENKRLQEQIASSAPRPTAPSDVRPESSPAPQPPSLQQVILSPDLGQPVMEEGEFFAAFPDANVRDYARYVSRYEIKAEQQELARTTHVHDRQTFYQSAYEKAITAIPADVQAKLPPALIEAHPRELLPSGMPEGPWNYAVQEIFASERAADLLTHLANSPDVARQIAQSKSPAETIRIVAQIEARLSPSVNSPAPAGNPVSLAPPPPATLGKKPAQPADELQEAIRTGDFARYRELQNRKEMRSA